MHFKRTRPLTITQLNQITADRANISKVKQALHEQIRRGVNELNELLIRYWPQVSQSYLEIEEQFNYRGQVFQEITKRFEEIDQATGWKLELRWNPIKLINGVHALQFRINKSP